MIQDENGKNSALFGKRGSFRIKGEKEKLRGKQNHDVGNMIKRGIQEK